jgi:hypothetical protein
MLRYSTIKQFYKALSIAIPAIIRILAHGQCFFEVDDGALNAQQLTNIISSIINITPVNDAPELSSPLNMTLSYTMGDSPVPLAPDLTVFDWDNDQLVSASVEIATQYVQAEDRLNYTSLRRT